MFNSTLTENARVWFDDLLAESIDSYDDLKKAFLENYLQQKKYIKDPIELHNIKQRDGESMEDFVRRYKLESRNVKGAPEVVSTMDDSTAGEAVTTASVEGSTTPTTIKEITLAQTLIQIKAAKTKVVTTAATATTTTRPKARGVVVQEPSEFKAPQEIQPSISKDK
ncbi:reverse transcriptase domain-containing protein [Tanacetum coccineum]